MTTMALHALKMSSIKKLSDTFDHLASTKDEAKATALVRTVAVVQNLILSNKPTLLLTPTLAAASNIEFLMTILNESQARNPLVPKHALLRLKGQIAFAQQIKAAGGTLTHQQVADLLGMNVDEVHKYRTKEMLIALPEGDDYVYPIFQFDQSGVMKDLPELLAILQADSPVDAIQFFLVPDPDFGMSPLDALKQKIDRHLVFRQAKQFGHQVAR